MIVLESVEPLRLSFVAVLTPEGKLVAPHPRPGDIFHVPKNPPGSNYSTT